MRKKKQRNQLCAICGKPIAGRSSKEHVFPRAIMKWNEEYIEPNEFLDLTYAIESDDNIVKTHPDCNYDKADKLMSIEDLFLIEDERLGLMSVYDEIEPYIEKYKEIKAFIMDRQKGKCYFCGCPLDGSGTLRRLDKRKPRTIDNGGILCKNCNENF